MPHIVIELPRKLANAAPLIPVMRRIHQAFAAGNYTPIKNMKSRVHLIDEALAGDDSEDQANQCHFVVGWLTTNNTRTREAERAMTDIVQSELERWGEAARNVLPASTWFQVCVMFRYVPLENYRKREWNSPSI
jgi:5-carboxymethyl-2-hydroxymuconate isomerase